MAQARPMMVAAELRVTQLWRGELMDEKVVGPEGATIGRVPGASFIVPVKGLQGAHPLFTLSVAGMVLNLHRAMSGTLTLGGRRQELRDALGGAETRTIVLAPNDVGLISFGEGEHELYFHLGPPAQRVDPGFPVDFATFLGSFGYSVFLHICAVVLLVLVWAPDDGGRQLVLATLLGPGQRPAVVEEKIKAPEPETKTGEEEPAPAASTAGEAGKSGGEGDRPRARTETLPEGDPTVQKVMNRGILKHRDKLAVVGEKNAMDKRLDAAMARLKGTSMDGAMGWGPGRGGGVGPGAGSGTLLRGGAGGPGGGGSAHGDLVTASINTGGVRASKGGNGSGVAEAKVSVVTGAPDGDLGGLSAEQIMKVVKAHQGAVKYCFEKELQRLPNLSGKVLVVWTIDPSGAVTVSKVGSTTVNNANVEDCLTRQVKNWKFPSATNGQRSTVRMPFVFSGR